MIAAIASQGPDYAGEGGEGIRTTDVLRAVRYLPRDHCRAERSLSTVVGRLDAWIIQETQQVAPVMVPTEFVLQPPVVRIRHGTVAEMIGRLSSQPLGLGGKVRRLSSVICLPELHRFSEQAAQTIAEAATSPSLGLHHLTDRAQHVGQTFLLLHHAHQGLRGAIAAVFGGASWQRCRTHFMTNLLTRVPRRAQPWVATMVRTIYQQPSPDEVHAQLDRVTDQLQNRFPQVASLLDEAGPDVLAFSNFPLAHWKKIWSNNPQERLNKEIRRRTDVVGIFPNRPAVRRLVGAVLAEQHDEWAVGRRYITPVVLTFNKALPETDLAEATAA